MYRGIDTDSDYPWTNIDETIVYPDVNNLQSINGVLRNTDYIPGYPSSMNRTYVSNFLDLLCIQNICMHCPNLGYFNSIGVRGESSIIKKIPVASGLVILLLTLLWHLMINWMLADKALKQHISL